MVGIQMPTVLPNGLYLKLGSIQWIYSKYLQEVSDLNRMWRTKLLVEFDDDSKTNLWDKFNKVFYNFLTIFLQKI